MKLKSPGFKLYIESFLHGTADMSAEQIGAYILLLCYQWDKGCLPLEDSRLKILSKSSDEIVNFLKPKFSKTKRGYINLRLERERKKQKENAKRGYQNGIKGGRPKNPSDNPKLTQTITKGKPKNNASISISNSISNNKEGGIPPERFEVDKYFFERSPQNHKRESEAYWDHYSSNGWMVGKAKMKDWRASVRNWLRRNLEFQTGKPQQEYIIKHNLD